MHTKALYTPLTPQDIIDLVPVILNEDVFAFIGGMPSKSDFIRGLNHAVAGPPPHLINEHWVNYAVRSANTKELIGRLEATVHHDIAEVAFLYSPSVWGHGYAMEGIRWLHEHLQKYRQVTAFWATAHPANQRSAALLHRAGYSQVSSSNLPALYSYDDGDLVFCRGAA
jgi:RimJ/RimL family protein N-acetyltransferase